MASRQAASIISRSAARSSGAKLAQRSFSSAVQKTARPAARQAQAALRAAVGVSGWREHALVSTTLLSLSLSLVLPSQQQSRGVKTLDFAGTKETVYERADWPVPKLQEYFKDDTLALIGYGSQGK